MTLERSDFQGAAIVAGFTLVVVGLGLLAWPLAIVAIGTGLMLLGRLA